MIVAAATNALRAGDTISVSGRARCLIRVESELGEAPRLCGVMPLIKWECFHKRVCMHNRWQRQLGIQIVISQVSWGKLPGPTWQFLTDLLNKHLIFIDDFISVENLNSKLYKIINMRFENDSLWLQNNSAEARRFKKIPNRSLIGFKKPVNSQLEAF